MRLRMKTKAADIAEEEEPCSKKARSLTEDAEESKLGDSLGAEDSCPATKDEAPKDESMDCSGAKVEDSLPAEVPKEESNSPAADAPMEMPAEVPADVPKDSLPAEVPADSSLPAEAPNSSAADASLPAEALKEEAEDGNSPTVEDSSGPQEIPEARLRAEVQALLVGLDLETTKYGELRSRLEERLGLGKGWLSARKSRCRRVNFLVQHEVLRRLQRSTDCDIIVKELLAMPNYPAGARQMLIDGLPHALNAAAEPKPVVLHPHQVQFLSLAQVALEDSQRFFSSEKVASDAETMKADSEVVSQEAAISEAKAVLVAMKAASAKEQASLHDLESEVEELSKELQSSRDKLGEVVAETERLRSERESIDAVRKGPLETLASGAWASQDAWWECFAPFQQHLLDSNAESSLLDAATVSFRKLPAERSEFDSMAVAGVHDLLSEQIEAADARIEQQLRVQSDAEAESLGSKALLDAVQQRLERQREVITKASSCEGEAASAVKEAKAKLPALKQAAAERHCCQEEIANRLCSLEHALALIEKAMAPPSPTTPEDKEEDDAVHPPLPVVEAEESRETLSEVNLLAQELISASAPVQMSLTASPSAKKVLLDDDDALSAASPRRVPTPVKGGA
eukprot:TRINITY_DN58323_c0_g1_i1.p1 TRINITY_DN58323_c0_g1~~TRINITY_DN58323_c0_g1_i1.p1  ORF type:complete len:629 (-),score=170.06 TRINITY_DN58323_c0_g1_i1:303-2189(-)